MLNFYLFCNFITDPDITPGARSQVQEQAISISLLMFGMILERFNTVLKESIQSSSGAVTKASNAPVVTLGGDIVANSMDTHHGKHHHNRRSRTNLSDDNKKEK